MKKLILFLIFTPLFLFSQKETYNWYFGRQAGITFNPNGSSPTALTENALYFNASTGTMSDRHGRLLFYTDGAEIRNRYHQIIPSNLNLRFYGREEGVTVVQKPENRNLFYIFTMTSGNGPGLWYSLIDAYKNDGEIIVSNIMVSGDTILNVEPVIHSNQKDIWLVARKYPADEFIAFLITKDGITDSVTSHLTVNDRMCVRFNLEASRDGSKLVANDYCSAYEAFDFNTSTGVVSNPIFLYMPDFIRTYHAEVSADGTKLYGLGDFVISGRTECDRIVQFDLTAGNQTAILNSMYDVFHDSTNSYCSSAMQIGPDKKIYISVNNWDYLNVINNPDSSRAACSFQQNAVNLDGKTGGWSLPDFLYDYKFGYIGASNACVGDTIFLYSDSIPGAVYSWRGPNGFSSSQMNPFIPNVRLIDSGWYKLRIINISPTYDDSIFVHVYTYINASITNIGDTDLCKSGTMILQANPAGTGIYYEWSTGETSRNISISKVGDYWVRVYNDGTCADTAKISVKRDTSVHLVSIKFIGDSVICQDKQITLEAHHYLGDFTYIWSTGDTTKRINVSVPGEYRVTVRNSVGCTDSAFVTVLKDSTFQASISGNSSYCVGDSSLLTVLPAGNRFSYKWSTGDTSQTIYAKTPGLYKVFVTSSLGCVDSASLSIKELKKPNFKIAALGLTTICHGDGLRLQVQGLVEDCTYLWSTGDTISTITVNEPGTYNVKLTNLNGCSTDDSIKISEYPRINPKISASGPLEFCYGDSVELTGSPFAGNLICRWSNGKTTQKIVVKNSGKFIYSVTNQYACTEYDTVTVKANTKLDVSISGNDKLCPGDSVMLLASPNGQGYKYYWSNGETNYFIYANKPGRYSVTVSLNSSCLDSAFFDLQGSEKPEVSISPSGPTTFCMGDSVVLTAESQATGLEYKWSTAEKTKSITVKESGEYSVIVQNADGCKDTAKITTNATEMPEVSVIVNGNAELCQGDSVVLSAGPTGPEYKYHWSTGENTREITVSKSGRYSATVSLNNFCLDSAFADIFVFPLPPLSIAGSNRICESESTTLSADTDFSDYLWSTGESTKQIIVNSAGHYSLTVTDSNGCRNTAGIDISYYKMILTGFQVIDFGTINQASVQIKKLLITNESDTTVNISRIKLKNASPSLTLTTNPSVPVPIQPNGQLDIEIKLDPTIYSIIDDEIVLETDSPCNLVFSSIIKGKVQGGITYIWLPDTSATIGDSNFCISLRSRKDSKFQITEPMDYSAEIRWDVTSLQPEGITSSIINGERVIKLTGSGIIFNKDEIELGRFCGRVFLSDSSRVPLKISDFFWSNQQIGKNLKDGSLTATGVCKPILAQLRLINNNDFSILNSVVSDLLILTFIDQEQITENIQIYNVLGVEKTYLTTGHSPGGEGSNVWLDVSLLQAGIYFVRVGNVVRKFVKM